MSAAEIVAVSLPALQRLWHELRQPLDGYSFQLGQPVSLSAGRAVLRLALGAPLLNDLVSGERTLSEMAQLLARLNGRIAEHVGRAS